MDGHTILLCITLSIPLIIFMFKGHGRKNLPPGPPGLVFLAKMLMHGGPLYHFGSVLRSLHARHGPIISVYLGRNFVFVADRRLAHSALIKGGGNFDSRPPPNDMFQLFLGGSMAASPLGAYFRLVRRNLHLEALHPSRVRLFAPARQRICEAFVGSLRRERDASSENIVTVRPFLARYLFNLLTCMCFGVTPGQEALDEMQQLQLQISDAVSRFPIFEGIFVYQITKRLLRKRWVALRKRQIELMLPLIRAPRGGSEGDGGPRCYADSLLELRVPEEGDRPLRDEEMVSLCTEFMIASMDTSLALLEWIMADLVKHPDVQAKLYEEVRGKPELTEDELRGSGIPYLKAIVMEGLRLHPVAHLVFPHGVQSDTEMGGYMVPKGADINFLVGDFGLDETVWTAARKYQPERFLHDHDVDITGTKEIKMAPFGAGRRMCPGYVLAILHAGYFVGSLVREFQWLPPAQGGQDTIDMTEELAVAINMKHPLRARIIPRA
ncbi:cytochrome P450 89A2-like [Triticum urartu]|uniref:cytochrome P450 89A2-like n=1 Tax=Triticum urartu TaxID=4572 RepID=UPI0020431F21|nr:cytochrome P450 89A2-like [Triticum urartu]